MPIDWQRYSQPAGEFGERFKFEKVGDRIAGVLTDVRTITSGYGETPVIAIRRDDTGEDQDVFLSFIDLRNGLVEASPDLGDHVTIELTAIEKLPSGNTRKRVSITVTRGTTGGSAPDASSLLPTS